MRLPRILALEHRAGGKGQDAGVHPAVFTMQPSSAMLPYSTARPPSWKTRARRRGSRPYPSVSTASQRADWLKASVVGTPPGRPGRNAHRVVPVRRTSSVQRLGQGFGMDRRHEASIRPTRSSSRGSRRFRRQRARPRHARRILTATLTAPAAAGQAVDVEHGERTSPHSPPPADAARYWWSRPWRCRGHGVLERGERGDGTRQTLASSVS